MKTLKQISKEIRQELKAQFPDHKFSVRKEHGIAIAVALMEAPESPFANLETTTGHTHEGEYAQLNHYHIKQDWEGNWVSNGYYLTAEAAQLLNQVVDIGNRDNWDNSDLMTDYFDVNYYFHLAVGKWDKPFTVKA